MKLKLGLIFVLGLLVFTGCKDNTEETTTIKLAKGGRTYGGDLKFISDDKVQGLFPLSITDQYSLRMTDQLFESLFRLDLATLTVTPCLAESFTVNATGTEYTLMIRKGVQFHADESTGGKSKELTAKDVEFMFQLACSNLSVNSWSGDLRNVIKGGDEYYKNSSKKLPSVGLEGVKVVGDYELKVILEHPFIGFEKFLAQPMFGVFAKESFEKYGDKVYEHPVGTGPFKLEKFGEAGVVLKRNENYWRKDEFGNQLPYLNSISVSYSDSKKAEMLAFRAKEIDLVTVIPVEEIENVLGTLQEAKNNVKHKVESSNSYSIDYLAFNETNEFFSKQEVRKAIQLAINTSEIIDNNLGGAGYASTNGFVPEMEGFDNRLELEVYNIEKAKALLAKAGYPNGAGFPEMEIYVNGIKGGKTEKLMTGVVQQLKDNLNLNFKINLCTIAEREEAVKSGKASIWRAGWIADYPDPISFLTVIYSGRSSSNDFNYSNDEFNQKYEQALKEKDQEKRNELLRSCAKKIMEDAVVVPLMNDNMLIMVNARVKGMVANPMERLDFSEVFIKEPKEVKAEKED